ncbi:hypothetical protein K7X08_034880 [Anisodus acutangulus]|uniref:Uncharacterized protein n=1 Tax=Anisodus acutangulus TaxID=402998 RepID=A0A9Q1LK30_9SOLA|nr:hypothetical protein K7X08_034880 [Anisodus acutangulus]
MDVKRKTNKKEIDEEIDRDSWYITSKKPKIDEVFRAPALRGFRDFSLQLKGLPNFLPQVQDYPFSVESYKDRIPSPRSHLPEISVKSRKINICCSAWIYFPGLHMLQSKCGSCSSKKQKVGEWERHAGSRAKKWKASVKVMMSMQPLGEWVANNEAHGIITPLKLDKHQLISLLQEKYRPVNAKWTSERCAICRWIEDWDFNKTIICNRCQIAVHQECYGAKGVRDFASWVCRACETPRVDRECCLCPVKGGALKPTDIDPFWVHVTCTWFRPEIAFVCDKKMEPAIKFLQFHQRPFIKHAVYANRLMVLAYSVANAQRLIIPCVLFELDTIWK